MVQDATGTITIKAIGATPTPEIPWLLLSVAGIGAVAVVIVARKFG